MAESQQSRAAPGQSAKLKGPKEFQQDSLEPDLLFEGTDGQGSRASI